MSAAVATPSNNNNNHSTTTTTTTNDTNTHHTTTINNNNNSYAQKRNKFFISGAEFNITDRYEPIERVGMGAYGLVISAIDKQTNQKVAIKKITNVFDNSREYQKRILREVASLKYLSGHENIIELIEIIQPENFESFNDVYIVTNYMDTTLKDLLRQQLTNNTNNNNNKNKNNSQNSQNNSSSNSSNSSSELTIEHMKWFMYQLLQGLNHMHMNGIVHRDIKPSNILVNQDMELRLCDMGLSREYSFKEETEMTTYVSTRFYRAPELLLKYTRSGPAIDVWSVGCIFAEMLNKKVLFPGSHYIQQLELILDVCGTPMNNEEYAQLKGSPEAVRWLKTLKKRPRKNFVQLFPRADADAVDLLEKMLQLDPDHRITIQQALYHPFFAEIHSVNNQDEEEEEEGVSCDDDGDSIMEHNDPVVVVYDDDDDSLQQQQQQEKQQKQHDVMMAMKTTTTKNEAAMMMMMDNVERLFNIPSVREIKVQMFKLVAAA